MWVVSHGRLGLRLKQRSGSLTLRRRRLPAGGGSIDRAMISHESKLKRTPVGGSMWNSRHSVRFQLHRKQLKRCQFWEVLSMNPPLEGGVGWLGWVGTGPHTGLGSQVTLPSLSHSGVECLLVWFQGRTAPMNHTKMGGQLGWQCVRVPIHVGFSVC